MLKIHSKGSVCSVWWLRLCTLNAGSMCWIPGRRTKIPHDSWGAQKKKKKLKSYCFPLVRNFYRLRDWSKGINPLRSGWTCVRQLCAFEVSDNRQKAQRSAGEAGAGLGISKVHPCEAHMQPAWTTTRPDLHLLFWFITLGMGPATGWNLWCLLKTETNPTRLQQVAVIEQMM